MAGRRRAAHCSRRAIHHQRRTGGPLQQGSGSSQAPDSGKPAKATVPQKAQKP
jgi:hypothetical protein